MYDENIKQSYDEQANPPTEFVTGLSEVGATAEIGETETAETDIDALSTLWACVASEVGYGDYNTEVSLTDKISDIEEAVEAKANASHTHAASSITGLAEVATTGSYNSLSGKPTLAAVATSGNYADLNGKPAEYTHPASHPATMITGLADVATSGDYADLTNKPTIPTVPTSLPANGGNADTVDNMHASEFAVTNHTHTQYATVTHGHAVSDIAGLTGELDSKADATHTHNYAASSHTHTAADVSETSEKKIMTAAERTKLEGIEANANNYTHPATHAATMITGLSTVASTGSYDDLSDKPTSMTPTAHNHVQSDISGLATALSGKADTAHGHNQSDISGLADALAGKAATVHTHEYAASTHTHAQNDVTGLSAALSGKANTSHIHEQTDVTGLADALAAKANANHTHTAFELVSMASTLFLTSSVGGVQYSFGENSDKNLLTEMASWAQGVHTAYSIAGTEGNPKTNESWRVLCHKTSATIGWVIAFGSAGSVFSNYYAGSTWTGWVAIVDASPSPLWTGAYYMNGSQTVHPTKKLSECKNGWMLLWSDYNTSTGEATNGDVVASYIPKMCYDGGNWSGHLWLFDVPCDVANASPYTETRCTKKLYVWNDRIVGHAINNQSPRNNVVLRAVIEM